MANAGRLASARVADQDAKAGLVAQPRKNAGEAGKVIAVFAKSRATCIAWERPVHETKAFEVRHRSSSSWSWSWSWVSGLGWESRP